MDQPDIVAVVLADVVEALVHRDAADPDSPAWEAEARIHRGVASLLALLPPVDGARSTMDAAPPAS
jgi:hypothetical protein